MTHLIILAHAPLASALAQVASHAFADAPEHLTALDVSPNESAEQVQARLLRSLAGGENLILTDAVGATPCNVACRVADGVRVRVVAGVSVPMLWRCLGYAHENLQQLVVRALDGGRNGVCESDPDRLRGAALETHHDQNAVGDQ